MKRVITSALVLTLLASSAAMAQEQGRGGGGPRGGDRPAGGAPRGEMGGGGDANRFGRPTQGMPAARPQPQAQPQPEQIRPRGYGRDDDRFTSRPDQGQRGPDQRGPDQRPDQRPDRPTTGFNNGRPPGDNRPGQPPRGNDGRWDSRGDNNRPGQPPRGDDGRWDGRGDNRWDGRGPGARPPVIRPGDQRFRDRDRGRQQFDQRYWRPTYRAPQRFRTPFWRPPVGFYAYNWTFGDYLPRGWYAPSYYLNWVMYGLPMPPIGAEWVRSGNDAILVDTWSGEVLSVYYDLFW